MTGGVVAGGVEVGFVSAVLESEPVAVTAGAGFVADPVAAGAALGAVVAGVAVLGVGFFLVIPGGLKKSERSPLGGLLVPD